MAMTRKEFLASAASVGALSACAGKVIVLAAVAFLAFAGMCGERYWLPRANSLRAVTNGTDTSTLTLTALASFGAIQRNTSFLPSAKERGPLVHSTGDVCKVGMGKAGEVLPYDEELEYLESNENQYIIVSSVFGNSFPLSIPSVKIKWRPLSITQDRWFFGGGSNSSLRYLRYGIYDLSKTIWTDSDGNNYSISSGWTTQYGTPVTEESTSEYVVTETASFTSGADIVLFAQNWGRPGGKISARFYNLIIDGALVLIPVLKDGIPCLYCKTNNEFYYNQVLDHQFGYKKIDGTIVAPY